MDFSTHRAFQVSPGAGLFIDSTDGELIIQEDDGDTISINGITDKCIKSSIIIFVDAQQRLEDKEIALSWLECLKAVTEGVIKQIKEGDEE